MFAPRNSSPPMSYFTNHHDDLAAYQIKLKKIIGLTVCSSAGLDASPTTGVIAYPAGCAVVLFNSKKLSQTYLLNTSRKAITAVAYSQCGRYLATGECGINPTIKVWELELSPGNESNVGGTVIAEFSGHKYAVNCVAFSPTGKYLVSVGSQHDNIVNVFDWKSNLKIASNKVSAKVVAVSFSEDGNYFVTVGNRHVKYWYLEGGRKYKEPIPLMGRSAILGELRNNDFCAVACGKGDMIDSTYAITRNGHLVEFNSRRLLDKWVMCRTTSANCMVASAKLIFVGCADAIIRVFNTETLEYVTTLPRTHYLGVDVAQGVQISHMMSAPQNSKYPDTIAIVFDESRSKVSCVYNDHSLYIWDLRDIRRVGKSHSFLYHSACIWGVETVPSNFLKNGNVQCKLPSDSFLTCSSDDTIRVWGLEQCEANEIYRKNIYSKELLKVIYIDDEMSFIKDTDNPTQSNEKSSSYDGRNGVRCIKVSADYGQLATGDRSGNIRIYNLNTLKLITSIEAHDSEVLCLEYTNDKIDRKLLASASRDRLIHVFDVENGYRILQTLDDHSSSITSVKFIGSGLQFQMISCGADKSIIFRNYQNNQFTRGNNCSAKNTLYDMEVDSTAKHILTACQDRNIRVYGTQNAKHTKTFKGSHSDEGTLIKLSLDLSGIYIATSCTDKTLSVYDYYSGECMAKMYGHSELVTGLKFTNDCKHLISASGDGCIFIWQVPHDMIVTMQARLSQQAMRSGQQPSIPRQLTTNPFSDSPVEQNYSEKFGSPPAHFLNDETTSPTYKLSEVGQLPMWAKRKPDESTPIIMGSSPNQNQPQINQKPRGKWAQRGQFDAETLDLRNIVDTPNQATTNIMISNNTPTSGYNSGGSKDVYSNYLSEDSSIDSGMENRRENPFMAPKVVLEHNKMHSLNSESNTEHDGDVEDISDGERTSSDHGMIYYPATHSNTPTDFKVNEMKEDELRKSIRRQKLEKQGLSVSQIIAVTAAGTGTNTSDDEDDASTPSGDNAERSLASTLGGSSESIPHPSTFLQVALDGPGSLSDNSKDKEKSRKSISAMHNIDNSKTTSLSKSYTNSKKEELLKVINEAKQKLENEITNHSRDVRNTNKSQKIKVGYKSSLRASQSISDLSHANADARMRLLRGGVGETNITNNDNNSCNIVPITTTTICQNQAPPYNYHQQHYNHNFLNCAAPKAKIAQNCHLIHQIQNNYPPYPSHLGHYYYGQSSSANASPKHRPSNLTVQIDIPTIIPPPDKLKKHPGILKNYKSCPVSPVHEELDWAVVSDRANQIKINESYKSSGSPARSASIARKRHTLYSDDAQTILDMIQSDTERMIAEITQKYGDLDDFEPKTSHVGKEKERTSILKNHQVPREIGNNDDNKEDNLKSKCTAKKEKHEHGFLSDEEDGNFSSDSLEDCSLDLDICDEKEKAMYLKKKKGACKKHHKKYEATPPKRSVSEYFIYEDYYTRIDVNRKVSLSDILNDDSDKQHNEQKFLETQRHSSASFFLGHYPNRKSQESILSDDYSGGAPGEAISFCNSMESILSDESECKSAPLEILFEKGKLGQKNIGHIDSKSYGSSPNSTYFDYYMQQNQQHRFQDEVKCDISNYGFDSLDGRSFKVLSSSSASKSPTHYYHQHPRAINTSFSVPQFTDDSLDIFDDEFIPSLTSKVAQYNTNLNKSLCKDFTNQRVNPMHEKFSGEQHPKPIIRSDVFSDAAVSSVNSVIVMKKSCSFEIDMGNGQRKIIKNSKKFEQNLQRFEKDRRDQQEQKVKLQKSDFNLEMDYVPHKPPVAHRRASSMKGRGKTKSKEKFNNTISCSQTTSSLSTKATPSSKPCFGAYEARDFVNKDYLNKMMKLYRGNDDEKSFEVYIAEKGISEDDNMDSLDSLESRKKKFDLENSMDSLEPSEMSKKFDNEDIEPSTSGLSQLVDTRFITTADLGKFRDIEKKIDIINKLVELEERKLEQERIRRENRVKPLFDGNTKERGFVKHLTKNFDMLAKSGHESINWCDSGVMHSGMKRNYSLPDVLEGAKFQTFEFDDIDEPTKSSADYYESSRNMKLYDFDDDFEFTAGDGEGNKSFVPDNDDYGDENESSIRRACSLSDLSMGKGFKSTATSPKTKDRNASRNLPKRSASSVGKSSTSGMGMRSVSVGMLNHASDSDQSEPIASRGGVMRPTISSNNKANVNNNKYINPRSAAGIISRRKGMQNSYSSVNLTTTGQDESSSEESPPPNITTSPTKPAVPPRPRNIQSQDQRRITNINTMLNSKKMELAAGMMEMPCKDSDIENADINTQFCSNVINQLMNTANAVLQLHQRLRSVDEPTSTGNNNLMLKELENAVIMTQNVLTKITARNSDSSPENSTNGNVNQDRLNNNHNIQSNGEYIQMIDKCSDLLNKVQIQKHVNNNSN